MKGFNSFVESFIGKLSDLIREAFGEVEHFDVLIQSGINIVVQPDLEHSEIIDEVILH